MNRFELIDYVADEAKRLHQKLVCGYPVDIHEVCEELNIRYNEEPMPTKIDGIYFISRKGIANIIVNNNASKPIGRRRFTACHEIGHHLICQKTKSERLFYLDSVYRYKDNDIERVCNIFAANYLVPEPVLREMCNQFDAVSSIKLLSKWFGITLTAMRVRMEELELLPPFKAGDFYR